MTNETEKSQFPTICPGCQKELHGPVSFCPYCRHQYLDSGTLLNRIQDVAPEPVATMLSPSPESDKARKDKIQPDSNKKGHPEKIEPMIGVSSIIGPDQKPARWGKGKWVFLVVVLIIATGLITWLLINRSSLKGPAPPNTSYLPRKTDPQSTGKPDTTRTEPTQKKTQETVQNEQPQIDAKREAARVLALGALRYCTNLSLAISKLPKMEKVLKAAQNLEDVSPRYQPQVDLAKKMLESVREDQNKSFMACVDKMTQLSRYGSDQRAYAVQTVKNSDLFPRERIVWNILEGYDIELSNGKEVDPKQWLSDFSTKFSNFVE